MNSQNDYRSNGRYDDIYSQIGSEARMSFSIDVLANIAIELQHEIGHQDRFQRLIVALYQMLKCDVFALLRYDSRQFIPLAIDSLAKDVFSRRLALEGHPRLEVVARAGGMVRFPADNELPDPYDGLIPGQGSLKTHVCIGLPLFAGQDLIGALTLDGAQPDQFGVFSDEELRLIAVLATGMLSNTLLIEQLGSRSMLPGDTTPFEAVKQTQVTGLSPGMTRLEKEIEIVAVSDLSVLVSGETGTGKELVVKAIHEASSRTVNPLVYLNRAALSESVVESELFRHMRRASTGAISNRSGKLKMADNGTLFLGEIGELSLALQAELLRVLQYGNIQCVDDDRCLRVDVCMLATTDRDLREEMLAGRFRAGLFHRLSMPPLSVPPLRERGDDVVLLTGYFCEQYHLRQGFSRVVLSTGARDLLQHCSFPGNVHGLERAIRRAVVLAEATRSSDKVILEAQHFVFPEVTLPTPEVAAVPVVKQDLRGTTEAFQRETIRQALAQNHHNWAVCARMLETDVASLHWLAKCPGLKD